MHGNFIKKIAVLASVIMLVLILSFNVMATGFTDVPSNAYYKEAVQYFQENGLIDGTSTASFSPDADITRGQLTAILWRHAGSPQSAPSNFIDVSSNAYYTMAIGWITEQGIVAGYGDERFGPDDAITRSQLVTILWRISGSPLAYVKINFDDKEEIPSYAADAVAWAYNAGIINGKSENIFEPNSSTTRAQATAILYRFLQQNDKEKGYERKIRVTTQAGDEIMFAINSSSAAEDFYNQLPLSVTVENYASNEKIFYPPKKLEINDTPLANGPAGTLAYYEPWGNVVIYYGNCNGAAGLYALGEVISGIEYIADITGEIRIEAVIENLHQEVSLQPEEASDDKIDSTSSKHENINSIIIAVGDKNFSAVLEKNSAVDEFIAMIKDNPLTIHMSDYSGFEKVGSLGTNLTSSNSQITAQ